MIHSFTDLSWKPYAQIYTEPKHQISAFKTSEFVKTNSGPKKYLIDFSTRKVSGQWMQL